jgi:hypothetical protein
VLCQRPEAFCLRVREEVHFDNRLLAQGGITSREQCSIVVVV